MSEEKKRSSKDSENSQKPDWLCDFAKKFAIINAISEAFDQGCNCRTCQILRRYAKDFKELFTPSQVPKP